MTFYNDSSQDTILMLPGAIWAPILDGFESPKHQKERPKNKLNICKKMIHFWSGLGLGCPSMSTPAK